MKFSELMLTGNTVAKARPGSFRSQAGDSACALGLAAIGNGCTFGSYGTAGVSTERTGNAELLWPWLTNFAKRPCHCFWKPRNMMVRDIVTHLFDHHVFGFRTWSLERLGEWVDVQEAIGKCISIALERMEPGGWVGISDSGSDNGSLHHRQT